MKLSSMIKSLFLLLLFLTGSFVSAANISLNQAAWVKNTSSYKYGHNSIPNIPVIGAPSDIDWNRWAMLHDGKDYRLYAFKMNSNKHIYQFAFNRAKNAYEYGFRSIKTLVLNGVPANADMSSFAMLYDGQDYRLYLKQKPSNGKKNITLLQFAWVKGTSEYRFGHRSIPEIPVTGFPDDVDWSRWQMLHDGSAYRIYAFKQGSAYQIYQGAFNRPVKAYQYGYNSISILDIVGMPGNSYTKSVAMLHDGQDYRFYFQKR